MVSSALVIAATDQALACVRLVGHNLALCPEHDPRRANMAGMDPAWAGVVGAAIGALSSGSVAIFVQMRAEKTRLRDRMEEEDRRRRDIALDVERERHNYWLDDRKRVYGGAIKTLMAWRSELDGSYAFFQITGVVTKEVAELPFHAQMQDWVSEIDVICGVMETARAAAQATDALRRAQYAMSHGRETGPEDKDMVIALLNRGTDHEDRPSIEEVMQRVAELKDPDPDEVQQRMSNAYDKIAYFIARARHEIGLDGVELSAPGGPNTMT